MTINTWQKDRDYLLGSASQLLRMVVDDSSSDCAHKMIREWLDGYTRMGRHERAAISYLPGTQEEGTK